MYTHIYTLCIFIYASVIVNACVRVCDTCINMCVIMCK